MLRTLFTIAERYKEKEFIYMGLIEMQLMCLRSWFIGEQMCADLWIHTIDA